MESFYSTIRLFHIMAGVVTLLSGMTAMVSRKGAFVHRRSGAIYLGAMTGVCATALLMSFLHPNSFLFVIGVFSFHLCYSGYRILQRKKEANAFSLLDKIVHVFTLLSTVGMWYLGLQDRNIVVLVFAVICTQALVDDTRLFFGRFRQADTKRRYHLYRILTHIGRMTGSLIAAWTAVVVNNVHTDEYWFIPWLAPGVIGGIVMAVYMRIWRKKLQQKAIHQREA